MLSWRCKLRARALWMALCVMTLMSLGTVVRVHLSRVREAQGELLRAVLGSRNTSEFVNPGQETILVDSTVGWIAPPRAFSSHNYYQGLESLVKEKRLAVGDGVRRQVQEKKPPFVLIIVVSEFGFHENRRAIRETWYKWARRESAKVVFFLGSGSGSGQNMTEIESEIRRHNDVIVDDHVDSYYLLPVKILRVLKWFNSTYPSSSPSSRPTFLVKTDHDVFNHVPNLVKHLRSVSSIPDYIGGLLHTDAAVLRDGYSKWYTPPELWAPDYFPWYLGGPCYILAGSVIPAIYEAALKEKLFHLEDVFLTGIVANNLLGLKLYALPEERVLQSARKLRLYDGNVEDSISFHPVTPTRMRLYFRRVRRSLIWLSNSSETHRLPLK